MSELVRDFQARLGRPVEHGEYMSQSADLRDKLWDGLSEKAQQEARPEGPTVAELAWRIGELRAANAFEAVPERTVRKVARAERPVAARIRAKLAERQVVENPAPVEVVREPEPPVAPPATVIAMPEPSRNGHAKAVTRRRQERAERLRLF